MTDYAMPPATVTIVTSQSCGDSADVDENPCIAQAQLAAFMDTHEMCPALSVSVSMSVDLAVDTTAPPQ